MSCPFCRPLAESDPDTRAVIAAATRTAYMALLGTAGGVLVMVCDHAGEFGTVIEGGRVQRIPYAAAAAAHRVAERLVWR